MSHASWQFRDLCDKNLILFTPVYDYFVFIHLQFTSKFILQYEVSYLFDLVSLCLVTITLKINFFFNSFFPENMMAATNPLIKTQISQKVTQVIKIDKECLINSIVA